MQPTCSPLKESRRALITGVAGFIGRHLTALLRERGWEVVPLDHLSMPPAEPIRVDLWHSDLLQLRASSCEVYGRQQGNRQPSEPPDYNPMSPYAVSKVALELLAGVYRRLARKTHLVCLRLFNVYGPDEAADEVVPRFVQDVRASGELTSEGDGLQGRDLSYVDDVVRDLGDLLEVQTPVSLPEGVRRCAEAGKLRLVRVG